MGWSQTCLTQCPRSSNSCKNIVKGRCFSGFFLFWQGLPPFNAKLEHTFSLQWRPIFLVWTGIYPLQAQLTYAGEINDESGTI